MASNRRPLPIPPARPLPWPEPSAATPVVETIHPGTTIGDFEVVRELGRGATSFTLEARQPSRERLVVLRVLAPALAEIPEAARRFHIEAALAARVSQPGILPVLAAGSSGGYEHYATALAAGPTLAEFIESALGRRGELFFHDASLYFARLARAVEALHAAGIIHRKISPANLFLDGERLVLTDFERAVEVSAAWPAESVPEAERSSRSAIYLAPEEFVHGAAVDPRTDVYSLGMCLYELCAGLLPFPHCKDEDLARLKLTRRPIAPRRMNPEIPLGLEAVIRQAIEANPTLRHATASELAWDLERFAERKRGHTRRHDCPRLDGGLRGEEGEDLPDLARIA